jgi:hypothetical protein
MAKSKISFIVIFLALLSGNLFALDLTKWKYRADITVQDGTGEYCKLTLTPDIYNAARPDLADIRLIDPDSEQVPYVLAMPKDITKSVEYSPAIINRATDDNKAAMVTLDFGKQVVKNRVEVDTAGGNFRRAVKVEGSNDNIKFFTVVETAYVFAITLDRRFSRIDLPANDYRYLRITVTPMPEETDSPVIEEVRASQFETKLAERYPVMMPQSEHSEDQKSKSSIYIYDLAYRHLPISEVELEVEDNTFYRYVTLEGRNETTRKVRIDSEDNRERFREVEVQWKRITSGTIYRYTDADGKKRENMVLHLSPAARVYRYLRLTIKNYDDRPLTLNSASAEMIPHRIVFEWRDNLKHTLYVGSTSAKKPQYDISRMLTRPLQVGARPAVLTGITDNPIFGQAEEKPLAWTEKHKVLLWIIMGVLVVVLGGFILKSFKSIQTKEAQS